MRLEENIKRLVDAAMERGKLSMNELAGRMGINQSTLLRIYRGDSANPRRTNLAPIARYFGLDIDDLFKDMSDGPVGAKSPSANDDGAAEESSAIDARMLHAHIDMLRKSAQFIAEQFGVSAEQVLASAMSTENKAIPAGDKMADLGRYRPTEDAAQPDIQPTMQEQPRRKYQGEADPAGSAAEQDRRQDERRVHDRRSS